MDVETDGCRSRPAPTVAIEENQDHAPPPQAGGSNITLTTSTNDGTSTQVGDPLIRWASNESNISEDTANLSPTLSFLSLDSIHSPPRPRSDMSKVTLSITPKDHPSLQLSGRLISTVFCLPHLLTFTHEEADPWIIEHRSGMTAHFESLAFLSSRQTAWKHTLIGWTGEITHRRARKAMTDQMYLLEKYPTSDKLTAPVPADRGPVHPPVHDPNLNIKRNDRMKLEQKLYRSTGIDTVPVWLVDAIGDDDDIFTFTDQDKWRGFTEKELFPILHYRYPDIVPGRENCKRWENYVDLNKKFADRILETYHPGDTVIVHDYQLALVPAMLRARAREIMLTFVLHSTFPSYEYFRCLPHRDEILEGMLGADTIVFQSLNFADNFHQCCSHLSDDYYSSISRVDTPDERHVTLEVLPLGLDNEVIRKYALGTAELEQRVNRQSKRVEQSGTKVILGRDRIDSSKGVLQKLQAYAMFLAMFPEWRGKVVLIQILSIPNKEDKERGCMENAAKIEALTKTICGTFGHANWTPVRLERNMSKETYFVLLRMADIGLVTSIREGMGTFAIEFALVNQYKHSPLLMSEFSGSANSVPGAISINPFDLHQVAEAINRALHMPKEDCGRMYKSINTALNGNTLQSYMHKLLRRMYLNKEFQKLEERRPKLDAEVIKKYSVAACKRLFIFDYDGTLTPIVEDPDTALPTRQLLDCLMELSSNPQNTVWVISGRTQDFLGQHLGHITELGLSAEHGCFVKYPKQEQWRNMTTKQDMSWQPIVRDAFERLESHLPGSIVEKKRVSITWHYRRAANPSAASYAKALKKRLQRSVGITYDIEIMAGKANLEVRPKTINKGQVVWKLLKDFGTGVNNRPDFVLCCGDDTTDEDMFRALRRSELPMSRVFGVLVGEKEGHQTMASWHLQEPADVVDLIGILNEAHKNSTPVLAPAPLPARPRDKPWFKAPLV